MGLRERLVGRIRALGKVIVAFSGGVDSTVVVKAALEALGTENVIAATGVSPSLAERELVLVRKIAGELGVTLKLVNTEEMADAKYVANNGDRCYHCKTELYSKLVELASREGASVVNGVNADDAGDHVHGIRAMREYGVIAPLAEVGMTKADVRELAREMSLPNWEKPALACLSSRVAYGIPVTMETLKRVEQGERFLLDHGFVNVRVRHHGKLARVEVDANEVARLIESPLREQLTAHLMQLGYTYVTVDLRGFRSGSGNE